MKATNRSALRDPSPREPLKVVNEDADHENFEKSVHFDEDSDHGGKDKKMNKNISVKKLSPNDSLYESEGEAKQKAVTKKVTPPFASEQKQPPTIPKIESGTIQLAEPTMKPGPITGAAIAKFSAE